MEGENQFLHVVPRSPHMLCTSPARPYTNKYNLKVKYFSKREHHYEMERALTWEELREVN